MRQDKGIYSQALCLAVPMMIQSGIINAVGILTGQMFGDKSGRGKIEKEGDENDEQNRFTDSDWKVYIKKQNYICTYSQI